MTRKKNPKPVRLGIKDLIVAMDQGGVKHCQRGTLKQRDHSKNVRIACLLQLFSACVTECTAENVLRFFRAHQPALTATSPQKLKLAQ